MSRLGKPLEGQLLAPLFDLDKNQVGWVFWHNGFQVFSLSLKHFESAPTSESKKRWLQQESGPIRDFAQTNFKRLTYDASVFAKHTDQMVRVFEDAPRPTFTVGFLKCSQPKDYYDPRYLGAYYASDTWKEGYFGYLPSDPLANKTPKSRDFDDAYIQSAYDTYRQTRKSGVNNSWRERWQTENQIRDYFTTNVNERILEVEADALQTLLASLRQRGETWWASGLEWCNLSVRHTDVSTLDAFKSPMMKVHYFAEFAQAMPPVDFWGILNWVTLRPQPPEDTSDSADSA